MFQGVFLRLLVALQIIWSAVAMTQVHIPASYLVLSNVQSGANIGRMIRSASIFGVTECIVVGKRKWGLQGDHGSRYDVPFKHFYRHEDCKKYLHHRGADILGVEIDDHALPISSYDRDTGFVLFPFKGPSAFVLGNEGEGLSPSFRKICDSLVYIPQVRGGHGDGSNYGSASLNVACAAAVVLQTYMLWAGFNQASMVGEKFISEHATPSVEI
mmetsp:Transcript_55470/g.109977  ORF Transcript_55470/g.109977 Transcript_55470/m.109977 type:complete len:214 (+) Transcript_55470:177-818(+)